MKKSEALVVVSELQELFAGLGDSTPECRAYFGDLLGKAVGDAGRAGASSEEIRQARAGRRTELGAGGSITMIWG